MNLCFCCCQQWNENKPDPKSVEPMIKGENMTTQALEIQTQEFSTPLLGDSKAMAFKETLDGMTNEELDDMINSDSSQQENENENENSDEKDYEEKDFAGEKDSDDTE